MGTAASKEKQRAHEAALEMNGTVKAGVGRVLGAMLEADPSLAHVPYIVSALLYDSHSSREAMVSVTVSGMDLYPLSDNAPLPPSSLSFTPLPRPLL